jgi:two-component system, NarL family, nitrate/nitrite response regulator NarL
MGESPQQQTATTGDPAMTEHDAPTPAQRRHMRVAIISDIRLFRDGIGAELERRGFDVVGSATDDEARGDWIRERAPDVVLVDVAVPGGGAGVASLVGAPARTRVVALGLPETGPHVVACAEAGMVGYVPRHASLDDVVDALHRVVRGEVLCPPTITGSLFRRVGALADEQRPARATDRLTAREREILELIGEGLSNKQIAQALCIELSTVKNHVHNVFEKLDVRCRSEAAECGRRGWLELDPRSASGT